ncbi:DcrB-related protein [Burkholderia sp. GS2Y]|uniref:DcrB-related protein n=1 Tax=Burkholderia theae TaxID=3143496 RepID=A0ABU9WHV8_9BURK
MKYLIQEGSFDVPSLTDDRTVNVLTLAHPQTSGTYQIVVSRDQLVGGEDLERCMQRQIGLMTRHVTGFKEIARRQVEIGAQQVPALELESTFRQSGSTFHQIQAMTVVDAPRLLVITLSSQTPLSDEHRTAWKQLLDSYHPHG